jgi:hypothetical protein
MKQRLITNVERSTLETRPSSTGKPLTSWNIIITEDDKTSVEVIRHNDLVTLYAGPYIYHQPDPHRPLVFIPSAHSDMSKLMFTSYYVLTELSQTFTGDYFVSYYLDGNMTQITFTVEKAREWLKVNRSTILFVLKKYPEGFDYANCSV